MSKVLDPRKKPIISHRGRGVSGIQENTIEAFLSAIDLGASAVEFDVRETWDEKYICMHDKDVGGNPIGSLSYKAIIERLGYRPPEFSEIIETLAGKTKLDIEFKESGWGSDGSNGTGYTSALLEEALGFFDADEITVTSFVDSVVRETKEKFPSIQTGLLLGLDPNEQEEPKQNILQLRLSELFPEKRIKNCRADFVAMNYKLAKLGVVGRAHKAGVPSMVWTVNSRNDIKSFLEDSRVIGVITDEPKLGIEAREAISVLTTAC